MPAKKKVVETSDNAVITETKTKKKTTKAAEKTEKKAVKKVKKATKAVKVAQYNKFTLNTCFEMAKAMGVKMEYHDYTQALLDDTDIKKIAKAIIKKYDIAKKFSFDEDGYDEDLILVILERVLPTMEITASDFNDLATALESVEKFEVGVDSSLDNEQYKKDFEVLKRVLMLAQRKGIRTTADLKKQIGNDGKAGFVAFTELAYKVLKNWTLDDVKYYEGFVYSLLSQFKDIYEEYEEKIIMDVADLYLLRGDLNKAKNDYNYVIRETKEKGNAYIRFASIFKEVDVETAKEIVEASKRYVKEEDEAYQILQSIVA